MSIIFLDIDGVLNTHDFNREAGSNTIHPDKVARLNRILREPSVSLVLSSAWRYHFHRREMNLAGLDWLLRTHGVIGNRLVGVTRMDTMVEGPEGFEPLADERGQQITDWMREHLCVTPDRPGSVRWVAIDDGGTNRRTGEWTDLGIAAAGHPFVRVQGDVGLTDADVDRAIAILGGGER